MRLLFPLETTSSIATDFAKAIQAKNLKKVDPEEEKKRREQAQQNRSINLFSFVLLSVVRSLPRISNSAH